MSDPIAARLHRPGRERMLALDGGGTCGIITLAFLERIEATLQVRSLAQDGLNIDGRDIGPLLSFQRYDMRLDKDDLNLDRSAGVDDAELVSLRDMVKPGNIGRLLELASAAAAKQVTPDDFPAAFDDVWQSSRVGEPA